MKPLLTAFASVLLLGGCATTLSPEMQARADQLAATLEAPVSPTGAFAITNERKPEATRVRIVPVGWAGGFSCFMGIWQLGDEGFAPDRVARLENALAKAFPDRRDRADLVVRRYDIYLNRGAEADAAAWGAAMGSVGVFGAGGTPSLDEARVWRTPKCGPDRMHSGWFDPADLTNNNPPLTVELDVSVFGRNYTVNAAHSPELDVSRLGLSQRLEQSPAFGVMVQHAMDKANARLIERISASLATNAAPAPSGS